MILSTKETPHNWCVPSPGETNLSQSPGVWRETSLALTPLWPPPCSALRPASSWYPRWIISTPVFTPVELRILLEYQLILQNWKLMVITRIGTEIHFIYRKTRHCSFLFWARYCQSGRLCTVDLRCNQRRQTTVNHLESQGWHSLLWPHSDHHHAWETSQHVGHILSGLPTLWCLYLQGRKYCRDCNVFCRTES